MVLTVLATAGAHLPFLPSPATGTPEAASGPRPPPRWRVPGGPSTLPLSGSGAAEGTVTGTTPGRTQPPTPKSKGWNKTHSLPRTPPKWCRPHHARGQTWPCRYGRGGRCPGLWLERPSVLPDGREAHATLNREAHVAGVNGKHRAEATPRSHRVPKRSDGGGAAVSPGEEEPPRLGTVEPIFFYFSILFIYS